MAYTRLRYHIVTGTKENAPAITADVEKVLYPALQRKAQDEGGKLLRIGGVTDHVHIVAAIPPTVAMSDFIRAVKSGSSRAVRSAGAGDRTFQWQRGYSAFTLNPLDLSTILAYVANQKKRHATGQTWAAYERLPRQ